MKIKTISFSNQLALDNWRAEGGPRDVEYTRFGLRFFPRNGDPILIPWCDIATAYELMSEDLPK